MSRSNKVLVWNGSRGKGRHLRLPRTASEMRSMIKLLMRSRKVTFNVGEMVLIHRDFLSTETSRDQPCAKLAPRWLGPFKIIARGSKLGYCKDAAARSLWGTPSFRCGCGSEFCGRYFSKGYCNRRNFRTRLNFVLFVLLAESTKFSSIRKPCTYNIVCAAVLAAQKFITYEGS